MRFESYVVTETLVCLAQLGTMLRPRFDQIAKAVTGDESTSVLAASAELIPALDKLAATTATLQVHVLAHDGLGEPVESIGELVLRARGLVLDTQFGRLRDALCAPAVHDRTRRWFTGCCEGITDMTTFVQDRQANIHAIWSPYRHAHPQPPGMTDADRASLHHITIRVAQRALSELRDEPEIEHFLASGLVATDLSEIHMACRQIDTVLGVRIDPELSRHLLTKPRAQHARGAMKR